MVEIALWKLLTASATCALIFEIPISYKGFELGCIFEDLFSLGREFQIFGARKLKEFIPKLVVLTLGTDRF